MEFRGVRGVREPTRSRGIELSSSALLALCASTHLFFFFTTEVVALNRSKGSESFSSPDPDPWPWPLVNMAEGMSTRLYIWCVKYRHKLLKDEIAEFLKEVLTETAILYGFRVESLKCIRPCRCSSIGNTSAHHTKHGKDAQRYFCQEAVIKVSQLKKKSWVDTWTQRIL